MEFNTGNVLNVKCHPVKFDTTNTKLYKAVVPWYSAKALHQTFELEKMALVRWAGFQKLHITWTFYAQHSLVYTEWY